MISSFLGGLALFLFGQFLLERSLQKTSRVYLQGLIKLLTKNRVTAILAGSFLAIGMQSSTIPVLTLIGLINRGVIQLSQAIGVVLGASIGTTITIQAISFDISGLGLWLILIGFLVLKLFNYSKGELLIGLGFMFYGIRLIGSGVSLFKSTDFGIAFLNGLCASPLKNMTGAFILTVISQSTLAALAVGIVLMREGGFGLAVTIPIVLGAHLGAGILPLLYSWKISGVTVGRQLGVANLVYRFLGVLIFFVLIQPFSNLIVLLSKWCNASPARELANAHTVFVLVTVCLFAPFVSVYAKVIKKIFAKRKKTHIDEELDVEKIENVKRQLMQGVFHMLKDSLPLWEEDEIREISKIEKQGLSLRVLEDSVWGCLSGSAMTSIAKESEGALKTISNLGGIRDIIGIRMVEFTKRRMIQGLDFSIEGLNEVLTIHKKIIEEFSGLLNDSKSQKVMHEINKKIDDCISASYRSHVSRICKGFRESTETRLLHTDAISLLEHMHWHIQKIMKGSI
jgi:phosphate:Na+ symporter